MKIKKRYWVITILLCLVSIALAVSVCYLSIEMVRYSKLNKTAQETWIESSLFVTKVYSDEEVANYASENHVFPYIGSSVMVDGKFEAYGKEVYGGNIIVNEDVNEKIKIGSRITCYFKPDNPNERVYVPVKYMQYTILVGALVILDIILVIICRIMNKSLNNNTFSDAKVNIMDIPSVVLVGGIIIGVIAGLVIGNIQVDKTYTVIDTELAEGYANLEYQF